MPVTNGSVFSFAATDGISASLLAGGPGFQALDGWSLPCTPSQGSGQGPHHASCPHGETSPGLGASFEQSLCFLEKNVPVSISHKGCSGSAQQEESTEMLGYCSPPACLLRVQFYLGQNEDESLGGSISESAEKPPQRGGGRLCRCDLGAGAGPCSQAHVLQKVTPSLMKVTANITEKDSSAFLDTRRGKNWAHKIFS